MRVRKKKKNTQGDKIKNTTVIELIHVEMYGTKVFQSHCSCMSPFCTIFKGDMAPLPEQSWDWGKKTVKLF